MKMNYTVIIPAYNAAGTIAETIESALRQTVSPARILVIDDGSTDSTRAVAETFGGCVSVQSQPNLGPGAATSLGMRQCDTPLIAAIDADDVWLPEKIERQLDYLRCHPACKGVFARMQHFGDTVVNEVIQDGWGRSTMLIRRAVYDCLGEVVDLPCKLGEMIDWLARAREAGFELTMLPEVLARRRVSPNSLSASRDKEMERDYAMVAIAALRRKRARLTGASAT
jgi:glycosyltransferase involved in cell wall biosynthesis